VINLVMKMHKGHGRDPMMIEACLFRNIFYESDRFGSQRIKARRYLMI